MRSRPWGWTEAMLPGAADPDAVAARCGVACAISSRTRAALRPALHHRHFDAVLLHERVVQRVEPERFHRRAREQSVLRQRHGREEADHRLGRGLVDAERAAQQPARRERERAVVLLQPRDAARHQSAQERERSRDREHGRRVEGSCPVELLPEERTVFSCRVRRVADRERPDARLTVLAHEQQRGALRRAEPLVAVAGVVGRAERAQ